STPSTILCSVRRCPAGICAFCAGPTLLIFFRVPCFGDHRYLPSFPTRRSSDLIPLSQVIDFLSFSDCQLTNCPKADSPFPIAMGLIKKWNSSIRPYLINEATKELPP